MRVFKRKRKVKGKTIPSADYHGAYKLHWMPSEKSVKLKTSDKTIAFKRLKEYCRVKELEREGLPIPETLYGAPSLQLLSILEDYEKSLAGGKASEQHCNDTVFRIKRILNDCNWNAVTDINPFEFEKWRAANPKSQKSGKPMSVKTINEYLNSMRAFINWMIKMGIMTSNPLQYVDRLDTRGKETKKRRAWTDEELRKFLQSDIYYKDAIFILARTGLRKNELQKLTKGDIRFFDENCFITIRSVTTKNKTEVELPVLPEVAKIIQVLYIQAQHADDPILPYRLPKASKLAKDLESLGIEYHNNHGDLDFHSLRHTFATYLTVNGVHSKVVQDLIRHSDANLTAKRYTDASKIQYTSILKELPETNLTENLTDLTDFSGLEESFADGKFLRIPLPQSVDGKKDSLDQSEPDVVGVIVRDGGRYWNRTSDLMRVMHAL